MNGSLSNERTAQPEITRGTATQCVNGHPAEAHICAQSSAEHPCALHLARSAGGAGSAANAISEVQGVCGSICPNTGEACTSQTSVLPHLGLAEALARFEHEASRGECSTARYRLPYFVWGQGPPLVFIHGVSDTSRSFIPVVARLANRFRCIAYDLPDACRDRIGLSNYSHQQLVKDVIALLDHLAIPRSYLLGSSFGSTIALRALHTCPERFPRAVLQGGLAHRPLRWLELVLARLGQWAPTKMRMADLPRRPQLLQKIHGAGFTHCPPEHWQYFLECTGQASIKTLANQALCLNKLDLRGILAEVRQPILLVSGDRDTTTPLSYQEVLRLGLPNVGQVILEGCGHVPMHTHPDLFAEVINMFLTPTMQPVQSC